MSEIASLRIYFMGKTNLTITPHKNPNKRQRKIVHSGSFSITQITFELDYVLNISISYQQINGGDIFLEVNGKRITIPLRDEPDLSKETNPEKILVAISTVIALQAISHHEQLLDTSRSLLAIQKGIHKELIIPSSYKKDAWTKDTSICLECNHEVANNLLKSLKQSKK